MCYVYIMGITNLTLLRYKLLDKIPQRHVRLLISVSCDVLKRLFIAVIQKSSEILRGGGVMKPKNTEAFFVTN